jgi:THAP domain
MGRRCAISVCENSHLSKTKKPTKKIHCFPQKNKEKTKLWLKFVTENSNRHDVNLENFGVCAAHFDIGCFKNKGMSNNEISQKLQEWAVPSIVIPNAGTSAYFHFSLMCTLCT